MRKSLLLVSVVLLLVGLQDCLAQNVQRVVPGLRTPRGYEQLSLTDGSAHALAAIPSQTGNPITLAVFCVETTAIRFRDDGTAPTASVGMPVGVGGCWEYTGNPANLSFIRQSASTATIDVMYYSDR